MEEEAEEAEGGFDYEPSEEKKKEGNGNENGAGFWFYAGGEWFGHRLVAAYLFRS